MHLTTIIIGIIIFVLAASAVLYFTGNLPTAPARSSVTSGQQATQTATQASTAIGQIGDTLNSIANKLG